MLNQPSRRSITRAARATLPLLALVGGCVATPPSASERGDSGSTATKSVRATHAEAGESARTPSPKSAPARLKFAIKYDMIALDGTVEDHFELAREAGFQGVEIDSPTTLDRDAVIRASRATGVAVHGVIDSIHWQTRFSDPDPDVRAQAVHALRGAIDDARAYGASTVLVVPGAVRDPVHENYDQVWQRSQAAIAQVLPYAKAAGVKIAIEVVWNGFITTPEQFVDYIDAFGAFEADGGRGPATDAATVGAYFDCSNMVKFGVPSADWIRALGPRLLKFDFKGYSRALGWVGIGDGDEDWPAIRVALDQIGYDGWATAEVDAGGREHLAEVKRRMVAALGR